MTSSGDPTRMPPTTWAARPSTSAQVSDSRSSRSISGRSAGVSSFGYSSSSATAAMRRSWIGAAQSASTSCVSRSCVSGVPFTNACTTRRISQTDAPRNSSWLLRYAFS